MATKQKTLDDAFYETLKDVYYAEKQSVRALTKASKAAKAPALKQALDEHREQSSGQVERLEQVFELLGKPARAKTCEAMQGLVEEMKEDMEDFGSSPAADAVLIGCAQAMEHYEISRYGLLKTWAGQLGMTEAADLLSQTLEEEKAADAKLNEVAEQIGNHDAKAADADQVEDEDEDTEDADEEAEKAPAKAPRKPRAKTAA